MRKNHPNKQSIQQNGKGRVLARVLSDELAQVSGGEPLTSFTQMPDPDDYDTDRHWG